MRPRREQSKREKFDFEKMKTAATHNDLAVRKNAFADYFERFEEFPSYLFDNESGIDARLLETITALQKDTESSEKMLSSITALLERLRR